MIRRLAPILAVAALALAACGGDDTSSPTTVTGEHPHGTEPAKGGWVGGEPDWHPERRAGGGDGAAMPMTVEASAADAEVYAPTGTAGPLRAGSVDDNADFAGFLAYLERVAGLGVEARPYDPTGRIVVRVTGSDGRPVDGAAVSIVPADTTTADATATVLLTDAAGTVRFVPPAGATLDYGVTAGSASAQVAPGGEVTLTLDGPGGASVGVPVDVLFVLDATGSMGDEIAQLRSTMIEVAERLDVLSVQPDIRFAMTVYRDEGDTFVTSTFDFTDDVTVFTDALSAVVADGGGDNPEALDEALAAALGEPSWRDPATTVQMMFVVADAPPHIDRQLDVPYTASIADAASRGITVHAIAASNTDDQAELVFRQIAQGTGGRFVFLAYDNGSTATGPSTDIGELDYEELSLGDLVVRLVSESLAGLTGGEVEAPPTSSTTVPPTNPPGQD